MLEQANRMIQFLNTHTKEQLAALDIRNRIGTILIMKKVMTLRNFVQTIERKCQEMQAEIDDFKLKLVALQSRGLPSLLTSAGRLLTEQYTTRMNNYVSNQITTSSITSEETGPPSG